MGGPERIATARERATAVVIRDGKVLLVHEQGLEEFHMPGGGVEEGEGPADAVVRELREETGLTAKTTEYLFVYDGPINKRRIFNRHRVFRVEADGAVEVGSEIDTFLWWDKQEELPLFPHVMAILQRLVGDE